MYAVACGHASPADIVGLAMCLQHVNASAKIALAAAALVLPVSSYSNICQDAQRCKECVAPYSAQATSGQIVIKEVHTQEYQRHNHEANARILVCHNLHHGACICRSNINKSTLPSSEACFKTGYTSVGGAQRATKQDTLPIGQLDK